MREARDKAFVLLERLPQLPEEGFVLANSIPGAVIFGLEIEYLAPRPRSTEAALERIRRSSDILRALRPALPSVKGDSHNVVADPPR